MRIDVALFELRLFKSRSQASDAIQGGEVRLNRQVVKPSHGLEPGDHVTLMDGAGPRTFEVLALPRASLSREAARALLREIRTDP